MTIPPAVMPTNSFTTDGYGICNVRTKSRVGAAHTKGGQAQQTSLHKSGLGETEKLRLNLPRQGVEPRVFGFEI